MVGNCHGRHKRKNRSLCPQPTTMAIPERSRAPSAHFASRVSEKLQSFDVCAIKHVDNSAVSQSAEFSSSENLAQESTNVARSKHEPRETMNACGVVNYESPQESPRSRLEHYPIEARPKSQMRPSKADFFKGMPNVPNGLPAFGGLRSQLRPAQNYVNVTRGIGRTIRIRVGEGSQLDIENVS